MFFGFAGSSIYFSAALACCDDDDYHQSSSSIRSTTDFSSGRSSSNNHLSSLRKFREWLSSQTLFEAFGGKKRLQFSKDQASKIRAFQRIDKLERGFRAILPEPIGSSVGGLVCNPLRMGVDRWYKISREERFTWGLIGLNSVIFLMWRMPSLRNNGFMLKHFTDSPVAITENPYAGSQFGKWRSSWQLPKSVPVRSYTLLTSTISHESPVHLFLNMVALHSIAPLVMNLYGCEHTLALYFTSGMFASLFSRVIKQRLGMVSPSLGASGCVFGLISLLATRPRDSHNFGVFDPSRDLQIRPIFFPNEWSVSLRDGWLAMSLLDFSMLVLPILRLGSSTWIWDHAAHLGGSLFGWMKHRSNVLVGDNDSTKVQVLMHTDDDDFEEWIWEFFLLNSMRIKSWFLEIFNEKR